jgi:hypothetical protein
MSSRRVAVSISIMFIVQVVTAAIGVSFVTSFLDGSADGTTLTIGALLMMFSGVLIGVIGLLIYRVLKLTNKRLAIWIPVIRGIEFVVATVFGLYLITNLQPVPNHLLWVYILAGAAGVVFTGLLFTFRLVPRPIAALGIVGYALLLIGAPLDLVGAIDLIGGAGQVLIIPGALFEVIVLPIWLIARGFRAPQVERRETVASPVAV